MPVSNCCFPNLAISVSLSFLLAKGIDCMVEWSGSRWLANVLIRVLSFYGMMSFEFYCVQEWIADKILQGLVKHFGNAGADLCLFVAVTVCGCALFFLNKAVLWCFDSIGGRRKRMADKAGRKRYEKAIFIDIQSFHRSCFAVCRDGKFSLISL